ncbi:hypothetical protein COBT_000290 [Conglomerata obtusa]
MEVSNFMKIFNIILIIGWILLMLTHLSDCFLQKTDRTYHQVNNPDDLDFNRNMRHLRIDNFSLDSETINPEKLDELIKSYEWEGYWYDE